MAEYLKTLLDKVVSIVTCDGRVIVGKLRGYDQVTNVVVQECHERVFSVDEGVKQEPMGLQVIRGNNIVLIGEVDKKADDALDFDTIHGEPLKSLQY